MAPLTQKSKVEIYHEVKTTFAVGKMKYNCKKYSTV